MIIFFVYTVIAIAERDSSFFVHYKCNIVRLTTDFASDQIISDHHLNTAATMVAIRTETKETLTLVDPLQPSPSLQVQT
jgi:hypothetical protein